MRTLIIGERGHTPALQATSQSGRRLERAFGGRPFDAINLVDRASARWMLARGFDVHRLKYPTRGAEAFAATLRLEHDVVVLLGRRVAAAFGVDARWPFYEWTFLLRGPCPRAERWPLVVTDQEVTRAVVLPHPSGRSRWWNDPMALDELTKFAKEELC